MNAPPKVVLLARPHPFIVDEMRPFLAHAGYATSTLEHLPELRGKSQQCCGAVISLAVTSSLGATADEVFANWHRCAPAKPVVFASLAPLAQMMPTIDRVMKCVGVRPAVVDLRQFSAEGPAQATPRYLYLSKSDLASSATRGLAVEMIQRQFH